MKKILEDIRVVDLTHVWFGPWSTRILGMLGAEVIKIEPPWGGMVRFRPPIFGNDAGPDFLCFNTDKKGITLDLKKTKGKKAFFDLVKKSDVVVNNFMPGTMERLGIGYDTLKEFKPSIIYAALSGYGQTGPYSRRPSFAPIGEAWAGYTRLNGDMVDPEGPPLPTTDGFGDLVPGTWAALCIIAAIR
jgi:crotonobetainyl-CoA:carnitine CoA-transferase CaiB-like acyl-CoA transferase